METNTAAIYLRRSHRGRRQVRRPAGAHIRNKAEDLAINIVAVYREDDGTSASSVTNDHRPEFERCLADYQAGEFDTIMVYDFDRWSRKGATEAGQLLDLLGKHNGRLVDISIDTQATGLENARIPLIMKAEIARTETVNAKRRILRGKTTNAFTGNGSAGRFPTDSPPFAPSTLPPTWSSTPRPLPTSNMMANWIIEGCSTTEVAHKLNELGLRNFSQRSMDQDNSDAAFAVPSHDRPASLSQHRPDHQEGH
jgi:site-specific DNA recombinase